MQPDESVTIPAVAPVVGSPAVESAAVDGLAGARIVALDCYDVRFPTSLELDGSDAMNPDPDYSAAYAVLRTDAPGLEGHALCFTIGRGNEVMVTAVAALRRHVVGRYVTDIITDLGGFSAAMVGDSQLRWLGPEKGVMHMAIGAVVNAAWDLAAKAAGKPVWRLLADMTPEEIVALVDFRYLEDALTPAEALGILRGARAGRQERIAQLERTGYPAYTSTPGWIGYTDEKLAGLSRQAVADGFTQIKLKVGADVADDARRMALAREVVGPGVRIAVDANQRWGVAEAEAAVAALAPWDPYWVEEPTSPDEILGLARIRQAIAPAKIAVGEHVANRVIFKQLLQAGAADVLTIDACRVAGVNENVAILLLAAKYGVAVCPHAGGVGLCEMVQHLAMFDFVGVSATTDGRALEYVDHLHEHFTDPVHVTGGHYLAPSAPGFSATLREQSLRDYEFPHGAVWQELAGTIFPDLTQGQ
ncbi:MAG TPA: enolase C-terminal domain-like protein [Solirubrobacteraceae bacterium]